MHLVAAGGAREIAVGARADGVIDVAVVGKRRFTLQAGAARTVQLQIGAARAGVGRIRLRILAADGSVVRQLDRRLWATWDGSMRAGLAFRRRCRRFENFRALMTPVARLARAAERQSR